MGRTAKAKYFAMMIPSLRARGEPTLLAAFYFRFTEGGVKKERDDKVSLTEMRVEKSDKTPLTHLWDFILQWQNEISHD